MDGGGDRVEKALVSVRGEVDGDGGAWGYGAGDFDVEQDFAVGAVGVAAGYVIGTVDGDRGHGGWGKAEVGEVGLEVRGLVAAAELDDADSLAGGADCGECVGLRDLNGGVRDVRGAWFRDAGVGFGLGTVVKAEDGTDVGSEFLRYGERALANTDVAGGDGLRVELGAEGALEIGQGAGELHGGAGCGEVGFDLQLEFFGEGFHHGHGVGVSAVLVVELLGG